MPEHRFDLETDENYTPPSSIPARHNWSRSENAEQQGPTAAPSPEWAPMRSIRPEELRPAGTPMKDRQQAETIVQLRGNRLDGTPLVVPAKDTHEGPQKMKEPYAYPPIDLLDKGRNTQDPNLNAKIEAGSRRLLSTLESFGVQAKLTHVTHGPAITRYELQPAPGVKVSRIVNLVDDIALNMASDGVRIEAPIPGKPAVGIEIPNDKIEMVSLRDILESPEMARQKSPTVVALGKGISGAPVAADMAKMPHVLIAGATGSGKSVCINTIINSIIYRASPEEVRLILIDPKVVELSCYNGIPHLLVPVVTDPKKASAALSWAVVEMEHRYKRFETMGVRNIESYNNAIGPDEERMSKIIVIIDELADLMMVAPGEVEESICRLAQLARAAGIHLVIATQRPSVNVITGVIKANIPSRIAFAVSSQIDSRTILDSGGAEKLLGKGDMLYAPQGAGKPTRVQGCFVSEEEVQRIVDFVRGKHTAEYNEDVIEQMDAAVEEEKAPAESDAPSAGDSVDELLAKAIELAIDAGQVSISMLQRRLRVGYARAGRLVDEMTLRGIAGEAEGPTKPRTVLITREEWRRMQENAE
ncbi:MAG: DNA translocase FtsK [Clostridia bacterium]|nr:DNA translocase FtsK [Clostridia bacterium]